MADFRIKLAKGYWYYCGMTLPWYASHGMVEDELRKKGFVSFKWHDRSEPLPKNVNPKKSTIYEDDWKEWLVAIYTGEDGIGTLPAQPAWVMMQRPNPGSITPSEDEEENPTASSAAIAFGIFAVVVTAGLLARKVF